MQQFSTVVGVSFRGKEAVVLVKTLTPDDGELLALEPEPNNEYDNHAVKVLYMADAEEKHIGYLSKETNKDIFDKLISGEEPTSIEIVSFESTIKPVLQITFND